MYCQKTSDISLAVKYLAEGRLVAFPTNTSYGLAADALQGHALLRLANLKQRPASKTFSVFMADRLWPEFLQLSKPEAALLTRLAGHSLTVLLKPSADLAHLSQAGLIGLRVIDHPLMQALADQAAVPLTATSANPAGLPPALNPEQVLQYFPGRLDESTYDLSLAAVLNAGQLPVSKPSTIIRLSGLALGLEIVRPGQLNAASIKKILGQPN